MARISNNTVLREILTELKELRAILHRPLSNTKGEDLIAGSFGVKETTTEKCNKCGNTIVYNRGIVEVDTFYCLSC
jgi:formamidopyrimidine-DNA glycosylase